MKYLDFFDKYNLMFDQVLKKMKQEGSLDNALNMFTKINVVKIKLTMDKKEKNIERIFKLDNVYEDYKEELKLEIVRKVIEIISEKENIEYLMKYGEKINNKNLQNKEILDQIVDKNVVFDICYMGAIKSKDELNKKPFMDIYTQTYVLDYFEKIANLTKENPIFLKNLLKISKMLNSNSEYERRYGLFQLTLNYREIDNGKKLLREILKENSKYEKLGIENTLTLLKIIENIYSENVDNKEDVKDIFFKDNEIRDPFFIKTAILEEMKKYNDFYEGDINMFLKDIYDNNIDSLNSINDNLEKDEKIK